MSTIKTDLLQNRLGTSHPAVTRGNFVHGRINFSMQGAQTNRSSFNISSLVDSATGNSNLNYTTPYTDTYHYTAVPTATVTATYATRSIDYVARAAGSGVFRNVENNAAVDTAVSDVIFSGTLA